VTLPFHKSAEEQAAEQAERERELAAAAAARQQAAFLASPIGQATTAKEQQQGFFEVQLTVGSSQRSTSVFDSAGSTSGSSTTVSHAGTLAGIEAVGWRLEHVGYVFIITGESSHQRVFGSGDNIAVNGQMVGIYLFRNTDTA
jgi:hypothetical protein